jgi:hypothetical protein
MIDEIDKDGDGTIDFDGAPLMLDSKHDAMRGSRGRLLVCRVLQCDVPPR